MDLIEEAKNITKERYDMEDPLAKYIVIDEDWLATFLNLLSEHEIDECVEREEDILYDIEPLLYKEDKRLSQAALTFLFTYGSFQGKKIIEKVLNGEQEVCNRNLLKSLFKTLSKLY